MNTFEKARAFVYRNARPLDFARWKYHFEGGSTDDVLTVLAAYQNADGGFGHALEPDFWNPESTPIATWAATKILREIAFSDASHPIITGILRYLDSVNDFVDGKWCNTVPGNNLHPHAIWWKCENDTGVPSDNPTVSLCGFALRFAQKNTPLYQKASQIAAMSVVAFMETKETESHTLNNFLDLLSYCEDVSDFGVFDLDAFRTYLYQKINNTVCKEPKRWYTEYVPKPSFFFDKTDRLFAIIPKSLCQMEAEMIPSQQLADGAWPVTWQWWTDYKEYEISANWWKACFCIDNLLYIKFCG